MRRFVLCLAAVACVACQTVTVPAGRVTGTVVTKDGAPIEGAFVDLYMSVPVGIDGSPIEPLGNARSRADGTWEIDFPEQRVLVNAREKMLFAMVVVHPDWLDVGHLLYEIDGVPITSRLGVRPPEWDAVADDCLALCGSRSPAQCREISQAYFGSEGVCDFRY